MSASHMLCSAPPIRLIHNSPSTQGLLRHLPALTRQTGSGPSNSSSRRHQHPLLLPPLAPSACPVRPPLLPACKVVVRSLLLSLLWLQAAVVSGGTGSPRSRLGAAKSSWFKSSTACGTTKDEGQRICPRIGKLPADGPVPLPTSSFLLLVAQLVSFSWWEHLEQRVPVSMNFPDMRKKCEECSHAHQHHMKYKPCWGSPDLPAAWSRPLLLPFS